MLSLQSGMIKVIAGLAHAVGDTISVSALCASVPGSIELFLLSAAALVPQASRPGNTGGSGWRVAVVVPAHDEAANIASCVRSLMSAERNDLQVSIYVVADNCTDETAVLASEAGATVLKRWNAVDRGKGYALDFAFTSIKTLGYNCVLVVDADTIVAQNFITSATSSLRGGAHAVQVRYLVRNVNEGMRTRLMGFALCAFNVVRPLGRERLGVSVGILGNGFGLRSETLQRVPYLASSVVEDLEYHLSLVQAGLRVRFVNETSVFGEIPVRGEGVKTQRSRWESGRLSMMRLTVPKLFRAVLAGRLDLFEPLLELLLLPLAFHVTLLAIALISPLPMVRYMGVLGLGIVLLHLIAASVVGGGGWRDIGTIVMAPFYVLWKLMLIPSLLRNARLAPNWVRTQRNAESLQSKDML